MIYFISDLHFGHDKDFIYRSRGFNSVTEHDSALISNWNSIIGEDDVVYVLGDIMLKDNENGMRCWDFLSGHKKVIWGNHDSAPRMELISSARNTEAIGFASLLTYRGHSLYLSHYPTLTGNYDDDNSKRVINICGHTHTKDRFADIDKGWIYHVEPDCHDNRPVSIEEILDDLKCINGWEGLRNVSE